MKVMLKTINMYNKYKQIILCNSRIFLLTILAVACLSLTTQYYSSWHKSNWFLEFQKDSEELVIGKIMHDNLEISEDEIANLYFVNHQNNDLFPYTSQFGLQGILYSILYIKLGLSLNTLHFITAILTALVLTIISYQFSKIVSVGFGVCFFVVCLLSPWITNFARNLYWVPFTWFLPTVISNLLLLIKGSQKNKLIVYSCFTVAIIVKSLCGYEYLSSVILFAIAPFVFLFITSNNKNNIEYFKIAFILCMLSLFGFIIAVLIHTVLRSDNLVDGIIYLIKYDVERRCYGSSDNFEDPLLKKSLDVSVVEVLKIYVLNWYSKVLYACSIIGHKFWKLCLISVIFIIVEFSFFSKNRAKMYFALCFSFIFSPLSWFMLAKAHSFVHTHMNYVLWYFGFVQVLYFILLSFVVTSVLKITKNVIFKSKLLKKSATKSIMSESC